MYSTIRSSKIIARDNHISEEIYGWLRDGSRPLNNDLTPKRLLTAATATGIPKNQRICFAAEQQSVSQGGAQPYQGFVAPPVFLLLCKELYAEDRICNDQENNCQVMVI